MSKRSFFSGAAMASLFFVAGGAEAQLNLYVPGSFIDDAGLGGEWDPPTSPLLTETSSGSGVYDLDFDLNYATNGTATGAEYQFKILNDLSGDGANWGNADDPELTPKNVWFQGDTDGAMTLTLDTNTYDDGYFPTTNRIFFTEENVTDWTVIGNFQSQLGGGADYNNADPNTAMTDMGGGLYQLTTTIPTPGSYVFRSVATGSFNGIGTDGRNTDAANLGFNTFETDQEVTFELDVTRGIRFLTDAVLAGDTDNDGIVEFEDDFYPIRDNFLTATNLRADGDLDFSGFVDIADFREWKNAFNGPPEMIALALSQLTAVPEPTSVVLLGLATLFVAPRRRVA